jgi:uncharacterized protein YeaO (DUF488 family)
MEIRLKRIYDLPESSDGLRVLVERLWPRGLSRERACVDLWAKEVAPSPELRRWYRHDPAKWEEFSRRYRAELDVLETEVQSLCRRIRRRVVTFVFGSRESKQNSAVVLKAHLERVCGPADAG